MLCHGNEKVEAVADRVMGGGGESEHNGGRQKTNKRTKNATDNDNDSMGDEIKQFISSYSAACYLYNGEITIDKISMRIWGPRYGPLTLLIGQWGCNVIRQTTQ